MSNRKTNPGLLKKRFRKVSLSLLSVGALLAGLIGPVSPATAAAPLPTIVRICDGSVSGQWGPDYAVSSDLTASVTPLSDTEAAYATVGIDTYWPMHDSAPEQGYDLLMDVSTSLASSEENARNGLADIPYEGAVTVVLSVPDGYTGTDALLRAYTYNAQFEPVDITSQVTGLTTDSDSVSYTLPSAGASVSLNLKAAGSSSTDNTSTDDSSTDDTTSTPNDSSSDDTSTDDSSTDDTTGTPDDSSSDDTSTDDSSTDDTTGTPDDSSSDDASTDDSSTDDATGTPDDSSSDDASTDDSSTDDATGTPDDSSSDDSSSEVPDDSSDPVHPAASSAEYDEALKDVTSALTAAAATGSPAAVTLQEGTALPASIMELLSRNASLKLIFSFNYLGTDYTITIPGGTDAFDKSIPWYGPQWLLDHFGPNAKALHTYKVVSGDTLSKIARRLHTTVSDLRRKNPQITDPNLIRIGQLIKY